MMLTALSAQQSGSTPTLHTEPDGAVMHHFPFCNAETLDRDVLEYDPLGVTLDDLLDEIGKRVNVVLADNRIVRSIFCASESQVVTGRRQLFAPDYHIGGIWPQIPLISIQPDVASNLWAVTQILESTNKLFLFDDSCFDASEV